MHVGCGVPAHGALVATPVAMASPSVPPTLCDPLPFLANGFIEPAECGVKPQETGSKCVFQCNSRYTLDNPAKVSTGRRQSTVCKNGKWKHYGTPTCKSDFPKPFIMCPADITKPLSGRSSSSVYVMIPQPKTNVDWFR